MLKVEPYGLDLLAADFEQAAPKLAREAAKVTGMACNNIKKDVKRRWSGIPHLPHLPRAINYDVTTKPSSVTGEVGADRSKLQGGLAWVLEYGSPTSAPRPGFAPAVDKEEPGWVEYLERAAAEVIEGRGA